MGFNARLSHHELSGVVIVCRDLEEALEMGFNARLSRHELSGVVIVCRDLEEALEMGVDWSLREGYAWAEDKEHCEEYGRMLQADPNKVSSKAKKRGLPQVHAFTRLNNATHSRLSPISCHGSSAVV